MLFTELLSATESADKASYGEYVKTMIEYKIEWEREIERCNQIGVPAPEPLPHPDDIIIDMRNGGVRVYGPWTKEEKVVWDKLRRRLDESVESICELKELAAESESESFRHIVHDEIAFEEKIRDRIKRTIGDWPKRAGEATRRRRS